MKPTLVIYNPTAGRGRAQTHWPQVENALREAGIAFEAVETRAPLDALKLAEAAPGRYSAIVGVGGDGTSHEIVNGLMRASGERETLAMGVIPLGSGDDFAKMIPPEPPVGGRSFDWRAAVEKIARAETRLFDVGRIVAHPSTPDPGASPRYFVNNMDLGFGAQGALNMKSIPKFLKGTSAYLATALKTLIDYPLLQLKIRLDDQPPFDQPSTMTAVMNGRCLGGGFWVCPEARADDGLFDLMVTEGLGRLTVMRVIPKMMRGTHVGDPALRMYRARRVVIDSGEPFAVTCDGEIPYLGARHVEAEILHRRLCVIV